MVRFEGLEPVARRTTAGVIAAQVRQRIRDGTFPPGTQLAEARLAESLGVSRGPVREALQRLVQEGLLRSEPHRGVFVRELGPGEIEDVYRARAAIERAVVGELVERQPEPPLEGPREVLAEMERAAGDGSWEEVSGLDLRFHASLVEATGSRRLVRMFGTLLVETSMCLRGLEEAYPVRTELVAEHRELLEAIAGGGRSEARALVDAHLAAAVSILTGGSLPWTGSGEN